RAGGGHGGARREEAHAADGRRVASHLLVQDAYLPYPSCMDWTVRELEVFVAAVDTGSFTDAALLLHVSQASVSRTVAALERALGDHVLRRVPRGCEPTAFGLQLLPHARRVLAEAGRFSEFVRSRHGLVRLG